ncbi:nonribosomal peptide synthetase 11, partial [Xylogone sp. PMI_703]
MSGSKLEMETALIDLIDRWAISSPDAVVAEWKGASLTAAQLHRASLHISSLLHRAGLGPRSRIPILTRMSFEMLAAVIGVLRLGACYVPMDIDSWSQARIDAALEATSAKVVLATDVVDLPGLDVVYIGRGIWDASGSSSIESYPYLLGARQGLKPVDLVYIIFTSGTTGVPKGVMIPHGAVLNLIEQDYEGILVMHPSKRVLLLFSIAFDGRFPFKLHSCAGIIFNSLCNGGTIVMVSSSNYIEMAAKCESIPITPSILTTLGSPDHYPNVREIFMGGEAPSESLVKLWSSPTRKVFNCYGPTECTTAISSIEIHPDTPITLGGLIPGVEIVLLNEKLEETDAGEICIRGPCLAVGYLNNEELTDKNFITWKGQRHYRTGDLARRTPEGLVFVGRIDLQAKNRGFLINLETEVVPALLGYHEVHSAAAFMHDSRLIGFVTPANVSPQLLREQLARMCDSFIVPDVVLTLDQLPLTSNGKVDSAVLRSMYEQNLQEIETNEELTDGLSPLEVVKRGFSVVLKTPLSQIVGDSSFGELGGNSLSAVRLASFLNKNGLAISIGQFFELDKLSSICEKVVPIESLEQASISGNDDITEHWSSLPISDIQNFMIRETLQSPAKNNLVYSLTINNPCDQLGASILRKVWKTLFQRHSILRTSFDLDENRQFIQPGPDLDWTEIRVSESEFDITCEEIHRSIWSRLYKPSEIPWKPFNYLKVVEVPGKSIKIFWIIHHSLFDGWSLGIFLHELRTLIEHKELPVAPQFAEAVIFQENFKIQNKSKAEDFWEQCFSVVNALRPLKLPMPLNPPKADWLAKSSILEIRKSKLDAFAHSRRVSSSSIIHAAWSLVVSELSCSKTIGYKISFSGRNLALSSAESIIGPMNTRCPFITTINNEATLEDYLEGIHHNLYKVSKFQWTSSDVINKKLGNGADELFLSTVVVFFDMPVDPGGWELHDEQKPTTPLHWRFEQDGDVINAHLRYECARFDGDSVRQAAAKLSRVLGTIVGSPSRISMEQVLALV